PNLYAYELNTPMTRLDLYGWEAESGDGGGGSDSGGASDRSGPSFGERVGNFFRDAFNAVRDAIYRVGRTIRDFISGSNKNKNSDSSSSDKASKAKEEAKNNKSHEPTMVCLRQGVSLNGEPIHFTVFVNGMKNTREEAIEIAME